MNKDKTDITLVVDRSGSMESIKEDAEGGVNAFIREQADETGEAFLTLVQFDTEYEFVHQGVPIGQVPKYTLEPRGSTALLDAVGRAILETGQRLAKMLEADRPSLVIFVVMTDGQENSSTEFTKAKIKSMIEHQQKSYNWHFTFLGANQDAFDEAEQMGIAATGAANFAADKVELAFGATNAKVKRMRAQSRQGQTINNDFTESERADMQ